MATTLREIIAAVPPERRAIATAHRRNLVAEEQKLIAVEKKRQLAAWDANALRTSAWETPNDRAIWDGLTPALKAARTAFAFPAVKEDAAVLTGLLCEVAFGSPEVLPRRFCSATTAETNRSNC